MRKLLPIAATALITATLSTYALAEEDAKASEPAADITGSITPSTADVTTAEASMAETPKAPAIEDMSFDEAIAAHILRALGDPPAEEGRDADIDTALRAIYSGASAPI